MPHRVPVCNTRRPNELFKDATVVLSVIIWYCGHDGSLLVHTSAVINIPPGYGNINTTIKNTDREVVIVNVSHSVCLLDVDNGWLHIGVRLICCVSPESVCDTYRPSYFSIPQQYLILLFCVRNTIPSDTFSKRSAHLY